MEVERSSFHGLLPAILKVLSRAHFISFDLELSGIHDHRLGPRSTKKSELGAQTLQERYIEVKEAAEKYQILQVGLTCVEEDSESGLYVARPYNFSISPLVEDRLNVERVFAFQSAAIGFLYQHGFCLDASFLRGVPYLSRLEEKAARQGARMRADRSNIADISLKEDDTNSNEFVQRVRQEIAIWQCQLAPDSDYLNIGPSNDDHKVESFSGLNSYQKRLVHQLVRAEFPGLVSFSKSSFVQIVAYDKAREDAIQTGRERRFDEQLSRQIGFRWLIEAMVGGDLFALDRKSLARGTKGEPVFLDPEALNRELDDLQRKLRQRRTVLVGHNLFTDLVNLYQALLGPLPEQVEDFQRAIHELFPLVIDTKYLATHGHCSPHAASSLSELDQSLRNQSLPAIVTHSEHQKYDYKEALHEAGFDSFLTAKVLMKLSYKLEQDDLSQRRNSPSSDDEQYFTASEDGGVPLGQADDSLEWKEIQGPTPRRRHDTMSNSSPSATYHAGRYGPLIDLSDDGHNGEGDEGHQIGQSGPLIDDDDPGKPNFPGMMPPFDSDFWKPYRNKLRVFGTEEGVCDLAST